MPFWTKTPSPAPVRTPPSYEIVGHQADLIEAEMKRVGLWQAAPLKPEQYQFQRAFAGDTMAFPQWIEFVFLPRVRAIVDQRGTFPPSSSVGSYASREFDGYREDTVPLETLLIEFDHLF